MSGDQKGGSVRRPRLVQRPRVPPGPLRELKDLLYELYLEAGAPSLDDITAWVIADDDLAGAPGRDTIRRILAEASLSSQPDVIAVATVLARAARWNAQEVAARMRSLWVRARMVVPVGTLVGELTDPFALEVHRSIDATAPAIADEPPWLLADPFGLEADRSIDATAPAIADGLGLLPRYVRREHDEQLTQVVSAAVAGSSRIAVLVGGSSTGKTRACWEAVHLLPEGWRVWHPIYPDRPEAALEELPRVGPRTVVWLNDAQFYLLTADPAVGDRVAAGLRELLRDPGRAPVLVLATLWPAYWETLTASAVAGKDLSGRAEDRPGQHGHARALMAGALIQVPEAFTDTAVADLKAAAKNDSRLALAADHAQHNQITQYLAGVPVLLERYRAAPPVAKAVIHAAMDACRLGHDPALPHGFLQAVVPAYLTDVEWEQAGEDWLEQALAYTATPCNGIRGPLTRIRPRPHPAIPGTSGPPTGHAQRHDGQAHYRLADYLEQLGRDQRASQAPPTTFWDAAISAAAPASAGLGESACKAGLFRHAAQLWRNAAADDAWAAGRLINLLSALGTISADAAWWIARHTPLADPGEIASLLSELLDAGQREAAGMLLARDLVASAALDDHHGTAALLRALREAAEEEICDWAAVHALAARAAIDAPVGTFSWFLEGLVAELWRAGEREALHTLAARAAAAAPLEDPRYILVLLETLRKAGEDDVLHALAGRAAAGAPLSEDAIPRPLEKYEKPIACRLLRELHEAGEHEAVHVLAARTALDGPIEDLLEISRLLTDLHRWGEWDAEQALAARVATEAPLGRSGLFELLYDLERDGEERAFCTLITRAARDVPLDHEDLYGLVLMLKKHAGEALRILAARMAAGPALPGPEDIGGILYELDDAGERDAARALAARAASAAAVAAPGKTGYLIGAVHHIAGREMAQVLAVRAATSAAVHNAEDVGRLVREVRFASDQETVHALAIRAAHSVAVDSPQGLGSLVRELHQASEAAAVRVLAARAAPAVSVHYVDDFSKLIRELLSAGEREAVHTLAARAAQDLLLDPWRVEPRWEITSLINALRQAEEHDAATTLEARMQQKAPAMGTAEADEHESAAIVANFPAPIDWGGYGYEPDGRPSPPWDWFDLA
jgi:hypothetical protein